MVFLFHPFSDGSETDRAASKRQREHQAKVESARTEEASSGVQRSSRHRVFIAKTEMCVVLLPFISELRCDRFFFFFGFQLRQCGAKSISTAPLTLNISIFGQWKTLSLFGMKSTKTRSDVNRLLCDKQVLLLQFYETRQLAM